MIAYHTNGNVLLVKKMLGPKSINNSMKYIGMINFKNDDFEETVATTPEEVRNLGKTGWNQYAKMTINRNKMLVFRKPKRFSSHA